VKTKKGFIVRAVRADGSFTAIHYVTAKAANNARSEFIRRGSAVSICCVI